MVAVVSCSWREQVSSDCITSNGESENSPNQSVEQPLPAWSGWFPAMINQPREAYCTALEESLSNGSTYISICIPCVSTRPYISKVPPRSCRKAGSWPTTLTVIPNQPICLTYETARETIRNLTASPHSNLSSPGDCGEWNINQEYQQSSPHSQSIKSRWLLREQTIDQHLSLTANSSSPADCGGCTITNEKHFLLAILSGLGDCRRVDHITENIPCIETHLDPKIIALEGNQARNLHTLSMDIHIYKHTVSQHLNTFCLIARPFTKPHWLIFIHLNATFTLLTRPCIYKQWQLKLTSSSGLKHISQPFQKTFHNKPSSCKYSSIRHNFNCYKPTIHKHLQKKLL